MRCSLVQALLCNGQRGQYPFSPADPGGNLVELRARVVATGRTSMHLHISVHAGDPKSGVLQQTTDCLMVFVAVDEQGKPVPVPSFVPVTDEQKRLAKYAMDVKDALDAIVELKPEEVAAGKV